MKCFGGCLTLYALIFKRNFPVGFFALYFLLFTKKALSVGNIYPWPGHFSQIFIIRGIHIRCMLYSYTNFGGQLDIINI